MLTSNQPLEAASQVLALDALKAIVKCSEIQRQGFRIIDRWAVDNPEGLKKLARHATGLLIIIMTQQANEERVLRSERGEELLHNGLTRHEVLQMYGVDMSIGQWL